MSAPFVIAVPAKGRLQENAEAFFARAGLELVKPRGARDYRGAIAGLAGVEVAYLSAAEIAQLLAQGGVHFGVTGEDLIREMITDADEHVVLIDALGFGHANVVVAVPQAWIDVHGMADLDDVATAYRLKHERKMRLATKYVNLARDFFSAHGITDYRIVDQRRRHRRRAGGRHRRVHRRHHHHRRDARRQRPQGDRRRRDPALAGQPGGGARRQPGARPSARSRALMLDRIAAQARARAFREVRTRFAGCDDALLAEARTRFCVETPFGGPTSSGMITLHCPPQHVHALREPAARARRRERRRSRDLGYVFSRANPLYAKLEAALGR